MALVTFQAAWNSLIFSLEAPSPHTKSLSVETTLPCLKKSNSISPHVTHTFPYIHRVSRAPKQILHTDSNSCRPADSPAHDRP